MKRGRLLPMQQQGGDRAGPRLWGEKVRWRWGEEEGESPPRQKRARVEGGGDPPGVPLRAQRPETWVGATAEDLGGRPTPRLRREAPERRGVLPRPAAGDGGGCLEPWDRLEALRGVRREAAATAPVSEDREDGPGRGELAAPLPLPGSDAAPDPSCARLNRAPRPARSGRLRRQGRREGVNKTPDPALPPPFRLGAQPLEQGLHRYGWREGISGEKTGGGGERKVDEREKEEKRGKQGKELV